MQHPLGTSPFSSMQYAILRLSAVIFSELSMYYANWRSAARMIGDEE